MTGNAKFLMTWADFRRKFGALGRAIKSGKSSSSDRSRYKELSEYARDTDTAKRHHKWWPVYDKAYEEAIDKNLYDGMTENAAHRNANQRALEAECEAFPSEVKTPRGVSKGLSDK